MLKGIAVVLMVIAMLPLLLAACTAAELPRTGSYIEGMEPVEQAMLGIMSKTGYKAGVIAISYKGAFWMQRGYGWQDKALTKPINCQVRMRIASVDKCFGNATAKTLIEQGLLEYGTRVFPYLEIEQKGSKGKIVDPRINRITINDLIEHKLGWNAEHDGFSELSMKAIREEINESCDHPREPTMNDIMSYMVGTRLDHAPNSVKVYSNFGSVVLRRVVEKAANIPYFEFLKKTVCRQSGITNIALTLAKENRGNDEIWHEPEMSPPFDCFAISAPDLCRFLEHYWISGDLRDDRPNTYYFFHGSLPGTTSVVYQRLDGINFAVIFNQRDKITNDEVGKIINQAIDQAVGK